MLATPSSLSHNDVPLGIFARPDEDKVVLFHPGLDPITSNLAIQRLFYMQEGTAKQVKLLDDAIQAIESPVAADKIDDRLIALTGLVDEFQFELPGISSNIEVALIICSKFAEARKVLN
jgi:hypothetical protein